MLWLERKAWLWERDSLRAKGKGHRNKPMERSLRHKNNGKSKTRCSGKILLVSHIQGLLAPFLIKDRSHSPPMLLRKCQTKAKLAKHALDTV